MQYILEMALQPWEHSLAMWVLPSDGLGAAWDTEPLRDHFGVELSYLYLAPADPKAALGNCTVRRGVGPELKFATAGPVTIARAAPGPLHTSWSPRAAFLGGPKSGMSGPSQVTAFQSRGDNCTQCPWLGGRQEAGSQKWPAEVTLGWKHPIPITHVEAGSPLFPVLSGQASWVQLWPGPGDGRGVPLSCGQNPRALGAWGSLRLGVRAIGMLVA